MKAYDSYCYAAGSHVGDKSSGFDHLCDADAYSTIGAFPIWLKMVVWADETKLAIQGVVASQRPGFGISIKFTEMTEVVRKQLDAFIQSRLLVRGR